MGEYLLSLNRPRVQDSDDRSEPVPFAHLWMVAREEFLGRVSVRYALNEKLLRSGGHVGYEVRPTYRGLGLGHHALALGLAHLSARGLHEFLITCRDDNAASARIIERAGGVLEETIPHPDIPGELSRRYWIRRLDCSDMKVNG